MRVVYVAGPFRAPDGWEVACNVFRAEDAGREVARLGAMPLIPHSIGARMAGTETELYWIEGTLELMRRADAVLVLPDWERSVGTVGEVRAATNLGMPVFLPTADKPDFASLRAWLKGGTWPTS